MDIDAQIKIEEEFEMVEILDSFITRNESCFSKPVVIRLHEMLELIREEVYQNNNKSIDNKSHLYAE